ncbi:MBL fold metallo-hydrolase [Alphaproteobacteria bacterium]|nr:MBL fold metallo-hydrolase [Alphaproteobacteria bacterium]
MVILRKSAALLLFLTFGSLAASADDAGRASFRFGGLEVEAFQDRTNRVAPEKLLLNITKEEILRFIPEAETDLSINAFVVRMNGKTILFDTGLGALAGGQLAARMKDAGIGPDSIDSVVITHMHPDHIGGLATADGKAFFPKAELFIAKAEYDWNLAEQPPAKNDAREAIRKRAVAAVKPYNVHTFAYDTEILPGVVAIAATGHTVGHTIYRLKAEGGDMLVIGDLVHIAPVQMPKPDTAITYDQDPALASETRKAVFSLVDQEKLIVAGMHLPFPAVGRITKAGDGFAFEASK